MSGNFISHLLDYIFNSVIKFLDIYLGLDNLAVLLVTFMGVWYSSKVYNIKNSAFSIMIPLKFSRKLDPVLYVWSNSKSKGEED